MPKTIIISGAAGNLGHAVTTRFLKEGFFVEATLGPTDDPDFIISDSLKARSVNLLDEKTAASFVEKVTAAHDEIEGAVLLVGGFAMGDIGATDGANLQKMYRLNFETAYFLVRPLLAKMVERGTGGQIVLIGSRPAINPVEGKDMIAYSLSKSLIFRLAEFINEAYADDNIVASVIVPGTMDTPANRDAMPDADVSQWVPTERVAETIHFLFTEAGKMLRQPVIKVYNQT